MIAKNIYRTAGLILTLLFIASPAWAERVKTDGKSGKSPLKLQKIDFQDSGYGSPGPNSEIRMSTSIKNSSAKDDVKGVLVRLQLKNLDGEVLREWTKSIPVMKKGAVVEFDPGEVYYNYSFNNLQADVAIEHDEIVNEEDEDKK